MSRRRLTPALQGAEHVNSSTTWPHARNTEIAGRPVAVGSVVQLALKMPGRDGRSSGMNTLPLAWAARPA